MGVHRVRRPRFIEDLRRWFAVGRNPDLQADVLIEPYVQLVHPVVAPPDLLVSMQDPAAGADFAFTIPQGECWELFAIYGTLVTDATVATRNVLLLLRAPGGVSLFEMDSPSGQAASLTQRYNWGGALPRTTVSNTRVMMPIPNRVRIPPGGDISSAVISLQAGDNWGTVAVVYLRHPVPGV